MEREETHSLISADKVSGTEVFDLDGERIGDIEDVMLDKRAGRVAYAILSIGGFLGIAKKYYHPLPWSKLHYSTEFGGYVIDTSREQLEGAPVIDADALPVWDRPFEGEINTYYGVPPYWAE